MIAVADTSSIILLAKIGQLRLLRALFDAVIVPGAVRDELMAEAGRPGASELAAFDWLEVRSARGAETINPMPSGLGRGELEVIALGEQLDEPATVLLDDLDGRHTALQRGLLVVGTAGLLVRAKEAGLVSAIRPLLDDLRSAGLYLSDTVYSRLLATANEQA